MKHLLNASLVAGLALVASAAPPAKKEGHPLKARLISEQPTVAPGEVVRLGVVLDIEPGWHTYWPGDNDSGAPTKVNLELPEGWTAQPIQWPAPGRYVADGDLLDYVYEGRVTLVIPLRAPKDAKPGTSVTLSGEANWLVCKSACIPGKAPLSLELRVANPAETKATPPAADTPEGALFKAADARIPTPAPAALKARVEGGVATLSVPGAKRLAFFVSDGSARAVKAIREGAADGDRIKLTLEQPHPDRPRLMGVLEVQWAQADKPTALWAVDLPLSAGQPPSDGTVPGKKP